VTFQLKTLSPEAVPRALEKAERYRLLNEPGEAESICRDALQIEPRNQEVLVTLLLAMTEQFDEASAAAVEECATIVDRLTDAYGRAYYTGIVQERRAKAHLRHNAPGCGPLAFEWLLQAMAAFERAEALRPAGNDDALLRWNACARLIERDHRLVPEVEERSEPLLLE
jgi:hypothetical protein